MKIRFTLKDPDVMHDGVHEAVEQDVKTIPGISDQERQILVERRVEQHRRRIAHEWMPDGEYLTVEFDTESWELVAIRARDLTTERPHAGACSCVHSAS